MCLELASRSSSSLFLVLLLTSALFVSISSLAIPPPVYAAGVTFDTFLPVTGPVGTVVSFTAHATLPVTSCSLSANSPFLFSPSYSSVGFCFVSGDGTGIGAITGSFRVRTQTEISSYTPFPGEAYTVTISAYGVNPVQTQTNTFTLIASLGFALTNYVGTSWTSPLTVIETQTVYIHGWGFDAGSSGCSYGGLPPGATTLTCSVNGGEMSGGFIAPAGSAPGSPYTITITGNSGSGDHASGDVTIVTGPAIYVNPSSGSTGLLVTITGIGFNPSDSSTCSVSYTVAPAASGPLYSTTPTCTMSLVGSWMQPTVSFTLAATATVGSLYTLKVTGSTGDFASDLIIGFTPSNPPALTLSAGPYYAGTVITVTSATFSPLDVGPCRSFTFSPVGLASLSSCAIDSTGSLVGTFLVVSSTAPGGPTLPYTITITGTRGDSGQTTLVVSPQIMVTPTTGSPPVGGSPGAAATEVTVTGTGFPGN